MRVLVACCLFLVIPALALAEPEVVQLSPDTYMISKADKGGIFGGGLPKLKAAVIKQANEFAARQGKVAIPLGSSERPMGNGPAQWATFEYQFRVVDKDDPEAQRTSLAPVPNTVVTIQNSPAPTPPAGPMPQTAGTDRIDDLYTQLTKLDDLRKRGIISEAEFETEKRKLLEK